MNYCKNYCEEKGISTSELNEAQRTLYYIAENMKMDKSISEEGYRHFQMAIKALEQEPCEDWYDVPSHEMNLEQARQAVRDLRKKLVEHLEQEPCDDMGEVSDGYHTFNQLYHQRAVLFATIVNQNKDKSWKSFKHSDGNYCFDSNGEWFIVGIDTPQGSYTYHYAKEYWDMFDCEELECGKEWDGHTEEDVTRLLSLEQEPSGDAVSREDANKFLYERIERLNDDELYDIFSTIIDDMYNELPSVNLQEPKWISVSERLPKIAGIYRVTRYYPNNVMNPKYLVDACCFDGSDTWYDDNRINYDRAYADNVIAWQENPEPYKVEPQESEVSE